MTETVIRFPTRAETAHLRVGGSGPTGSFVSGGGSTAVDVQEKLPAVISGNVLAKPIEIDKLYPASEAARPDLVKALQFLADGIRLLEVGRSKMMQKDLIGSDVEIGKFQLLLPELFALRKIGDGFGAVINAIEIAFVNQRGKPLTEKQILLLWRTAKELRAHPFINTDDAVDFAEHLEACGLLVDPVTIGDLFDAED